MKSFKVKIIACAIVLGAAAPSLTMAGALDAYMPGDEMGHGMLMSRSVFNAFFTDDKAEKMREPEEFMKMYQTMSERDKAIVAAACSTTDAARAGFSDQIKPACRAVGF